MSSPLAIAGVTAVLQHFLGVVYNSPGSVLGSVLVSAVAPDVVQTNLGSGNNSQLQVNLFLHQVTPNVGWRNMDLPRLAGDGSTPLQNQPLALDLHYLLTAYATEDSQAEALLSLGVFLLHENPVFARSAIRAALTSPPPTYPPAYAAALKASGLADQIEMIKVTPATMNREELAWLWTALKADYRPTFPFQVSVVLIEPQTAATLALPVLSRNIFVKPGPPPLLFETQLALGQTAAAQGDMVSVTGQSLGGANRVSLSNPRLGINYPPFAPASTTSSLLTFKVPTDPSNLPAGVYNLSAQFTDTVSNAVILSTNPIAFPIAPTVVGTPTSTNNAAGTLVSLTCAPDVLPSQAVSLALGSNSAPAQTFDSQTNTLSFQFPTLSGKFLVRLRVDGVDSPVGVDWNAKPPVFTGPFVTI
jgi:Pvc16 N-terminal domain